MAHMSVTPVPVEDTSATSTTTAVEYYYGTVLYGSSRTAPLSLEVVVLRLPLAGPVAGATMPVRTDHWPGGQPETRTSSRSDSES